MHTRLLRSSFAVGFSLVGFSLVAVACGSSDSTTSTSEAGGAGGGGAGGSAGSGKGGAGHGGSGTTAGAPSGGSGGAATKAGAGGTLAGGTAGGSAGAGGKAGGSSAGKGGGGASAGSGGSSAGAGGTVTTAGSGGASGCKVDADCTALVPPTSPANCAVGVCHTADGTCGFHSIDADGDGHDTEKCKSEDPSKVVIIGDDCDDTNASISPDGWDGPADGSKPDNCGDGVDQDCSGVPDDGKTAGGATCTCNPGDEAPCSEDSNGQPVTWPTGAPLAPGESPTVQYCKYGSKQCLASGVYGPCTGVIPPKSADTCDGKDDNCNGIVGDNPTDPKYWVYDGDGDSHGAPGSTTPACTAPTDVPGCGDAAGSGGSGGASSCTLAAPGTWKLNIPADDCNDASPAIFPGATELCTDDIDTDCDGNPFNGCACKPGDTQTCWTYPGGTSGVVFDTAESASICHLGTQTCPTGQFGTCNDEVLPQGELCNGKDDDCNGVVDDFNGAGTVCNVGGSTVGACANGGKLACPTMGCAANDPIVGTQAWGTTAEPAGPNDFLSQWDTNCDGLIETQATRHIKSGNQSYSIPVGTDFNIKCTDADGTDTAFDPTNATQASADCAKHLSNETATGCPSLYFYSDCSLIPSGCEKHGLPPGPHAPCIEYYPACGASIVRVDCVALTNSPTCNGNALVYAGVLQCQ